MSETKDDDDKEPASEPIAEKKADGEKVLVAQDQVRERALATSSSSSSSRQMALAEDLALAKEIRSEKKEQFYATAGDDKAAQTSPVVKVCCGAAALAILLLVGFVAYSLLASQSNDASLEEKIISGDKLEGLKALRQHSIQNLFSTFAIVVGVLVLGIFAGFGLMLYFKDTTQHQSQRRMEMVRAATNTFEFSEDLMAQLTANLQVQLATVGNLERDVERYTEQIEKLNEEGSNNREQIDVVMRLNSTYPKLQLFPCTLFLSISPATLSEAAAVENNSKHTFTLSLHLSPSHRRRSATPTT